MEEPMHAVVRATAETWSTWADSHRPALELAAVAGTAAIHLAWPQTDLPRVVLVVPMVTAWLAYVLSRWTRDPASVAHWGLRREGLAQTAMAMAAVMAVGLAAMGLYGWYTSAPVPPVHALLLLVTYPIFGLVQQLIVQGLVTGNLARLPGRWGHPAVVTLASASLFGLVHWPHTELMIGTFFLGLAFAPIWLKWRNLFPLGVVHGWMGMVIFYVVLQQDPVLSYFG
jgi:uncharacterized protein